MVFGSGALSQVGDLLGSGYELLSTARALADAGQLREAAAAVHEVAPGRVDEIAAALRPLLGGELIVAFGGGRVIDVAKALAAADPPRRVAAIPTTLSGAEMTAVHRHAAGVPFETPRVRPAIVVNDPLISASQPVAELAASAANALGHAVEGPTTPLASPVPTLAALESARLIARAFGFPDQGGPDPDNADVAAGPTNKADVAAGPTHPDRDALALGALLAGYAIGSTGYGLHHVVSQTLVRFADVGHGAANALMLPHTVLALTDRAPGVIARLGDAVGGDPAALAARLRDLTGVRSLREANVSESQLDTCAAEAAARPELHLTPPAADERELRDLYAAAF